MFIVTDGEPQRGPGQARTTADPIRSLLPIEECIGLSHAGRRPDPVEVVLWCLHLFPT